tara:strand:- start:20 stop:313 length:294 start_codon:yes stop_codon:yes gene_type:complete
MTSPATKIDALGGVRKTAAILGVPPTTVQHWKTQDRVPAWRADDLEKAYSSHVQPDTPEPFSETRTVVCDVCERRVDGMVPNSCSFVDCPHAQREAA